MTRGRQSTGRIGEDLVAERLRAEGWRILERNARTRHGELDIVALEGGALVFVEIKAARSGTSRGPVHPLESVGARKRLRLRRLATAWMAERRDLPRYREIRFDAVGVILDAAARPAAFEHIRGAF